MFTGEDTPQPAAQREPGFLLDALAGDARHWPDWLLDDDLQRQIRLTLIEHVVEQKLVIAFTAGACTGTITASPDASGYLRVVVATDGAEFLTGYVERVWEEHEIWPPGATAEVGEQAPGRLGKRRSWISVSTRGWPQLRPIANENGWVNLLQLDAAPTE
jgi:hypothetical protein